MAKKLNTWSIVDVEDGCVVAECYGTEEDAAARVRRYQLDTGYRAEARIYGTTAQAAARLRA